LGITSTVYVSLAAFAVVIFLLLSARYAECRRALLDREGMTLSPLGIGRLRVRPFHFRWDEVVEVRRMPFGTMRLRLSRPRKFGTFRSQPKNSVRIPKGIWTNPQFTETLRTSVPAERIHAEPPFDERLSWPVRHWWILAPVMLICAAAAAGCSFIAFRSPDFIGFLMRVSLELVILCLGLAMLLCADRARPAFRVVAGFLLTFVFTGSSIIMEALLWSHGLKLIAGYWGALAGALVGAAIVVINGRKSRAWPYAGATFLLAAAGFCCGWAGFHQVAGIRLGVAWLDGRGPWTPKGDAFLIREGASVGFSNEPTTVRWYSSDLKLERRAVLPVDVHLLAIGQEAALFAVWRKEGSQLWFVSRHAEARVIDTAPNFGHGRISPDRRRILIPIPDAEGKSQALKICDLEAGTVEPVNFPVPLSEITVIALRDDGSVLWLSGSGPLDKENRPWPRANPVPESGEFPHPGKPYVVWSWKVNSADAPAQLYAAKTQWLSWGRSATTGRLNVVRVAENPPARTEYVALDFTQSPPAETTISEEEFGRTWRLPQDKSFDGRFAHEWGITGRFAPACIVDTKSGRTFGMQSTAFIGVSLYWSPSAHKFLLELPELKLTGGRWHWRDSSEEMFEGAMVVYFVDMDRQ
jgi:hypothetical protein